MTKFRAFIAVEIGDLPELKRLHSDLKVLEPSVKAVNPAHLHVTLRFLGDIDEDRVPRLEEALRSAASGVVPFTLRMQGCGTFPPKGSARVVWVGLQGSEPLALMASRLEEQLQAMGFEPEGRPFKPHLTMARVKDPRASGSIARMVEKYAAIEFGSVHVDKVLLKKSVLGPKGPTYTTVITSPLVGR